MGERIKKIIKKNKGCNLWPVIMLSFMISLFAPFEIYLSNKDWFFFDGTELLPFSLILFVAIIIVLFVLLIISAIIGHRLINIVTSGIWLTAIALYIQGNYLVVDYGIMDGTPVDWSSYKTEGIISVFVFVIIILVGVILYRKLDHTSLDKVMRISSICIILIQIFTLVTLLITKDGLTREDEYVSTTIDEFNLSKNENFIILMLDSFDSNAFDYILEDGNADEYRDILRDFTYFPDTLADYSYTDLAFPAILTGEKYYNDITYGEYLTNAYKKSPLLNRLESDNWYCGVYTTSLFANNDDTLKIDNCRRIRRTVSSHRRLAGFMYKFVGYRYLIQPLKRYFWFYPDDMKTSLTDTGISGVYTFDFNNIIFYDSIDDMQATMEDKSFHLYHIDGTHPPFDLTTDFIDNGANNWNEDGIYDEARAMMVLIDKFCNRLRALDIYDDSNIIIMADHGYLQKRQSPIFMIKSKGADHPFETEADIQLSYSDLQGIFLNILDGQSAPESIVDIPRGNRERIYKYYKWNVNLGYDSYARDLTEYKVFGNCRDVDNLQPTGNVYSHGIK